MMVFGRLQGALAGSFQGQSSPMPGSQRTLPSSVQSLPPPPSVTSLPPSASRLPFPPSHYSATNPASRMNVEKNVIGATQCPVVGLLSLLKFA